MFIALVSIIVFVCVLLVLVVLAQNSKGGGLSGQFGGAGTSQLMGVKRTGDLLEKLTWGFAITIIVLTLATHTILDSSEAAGPARSLNQERARQQPSAPAAAQPAAPVQQEQVAPAAGDAAPVEIPVQETQPAAQPEAQPAQ